MKFLSKIFGHKTTNPVKQDVEMQAQCDGILNSELLGWAKPYLDEKTRQSEAIRGKESTKQREKRILAAQKAREENRAPLFEVMAVPEDERSESENQWVRRYFNGREEWLKRIESQ